MFINERNLTTTEVARVKSSPCHPVGYIKIHEGLLPNKYYLVIKTETLIVPLS